MNRAPAFGVRGACSPFLGDSRGRGRCESAGKPDALQTLRGVRRRLVGRASVWSAGACSRFVEGHQWSREMPKRRQAGRTPNASRSSEALGRSRERLECVELAPAFWGTAVVAGDVKAPASRTHSKRFAEFGGAW